MPRGGMPTRRQAILTAGAAMTLTACAPARADRLTPTPPMTAGPFFPDPPPRETDRDLVRVTGADADALGQVTHLRGRVVTARGEAVAGAQVVLWHCDAAGAYWSRRDRGGLAVDPGFQGFGAVRTDQDGGFRFRTIRPGVYGARARHFHVRVEAVDGPALTSQLFFASEAEANARDGLYRRLSAEERERATLAFAQVDAVEPGAIGADAVLVLA